VAVPASSGQQTVLVVLGVVFGGFFLIVMIGILAAIAIPQFASTKEKAYVAAMKSDLRNLVTAEERFFADSVTYTPSLSAAQFVPSTGVTVRIVDASRTGWRAIATSSGTTRTCSIFVGGSGQAAGEREGEPRCQ
jgi:Tfp pilus assembly major pilin PilA